MLIIYSITFHIPVSSGTLVVAFKPKGKEHFRTEAILFFSFYKILT